MNTKMFQYSKINESEAVKTYAGSFAHTGITDVSRLNWMSRLAAIKQMVDGPINESERRLCESLGINLNESYGASSTDAITGMGPTTWPSDPGTGVGAQPGAWHRPDYKLGSGDIPTQIMGLAMNVAAHTIGFDLVTVIPVDMPTGIMQFLDSVYGGGDLDTAAAPQYLQLGDDNITAAFPWANYTYGNYIFIGEDATGNGKAIRGRYIGKSQFSGKLLFKMEGTGDIASKVFTPKAAPQYSVVDVLADLATGGASITPGSTATAADGTATTLAKPTVDFVSSIREHIGGASNSDGISLDPMSREKLEQGTGNKIQLKLWSKSYEIKGIDIEADITRIQLKDLKSYGIDGLAMLYKAGQNQLTQTINDQIINRMAQLGVKNAAQMKVSQNLDLNLFIGPAGTANKALTAFSSQTFVDPLGVDRRAGFGNIPNAETNSSAENNSTRQRRLYSRILAASNVIENVSRYGAGDVAVVNSQLATALQDCAGFIIAPTPNTITSTNGLNYIGNAGKVKVYTNPKWKWDDTRIVVGRKGTEDDPGIKFVAYDLASSVEIISPATFAPVLSIQSRYEIVDAGYFPEANYLTFLVHSDFGQWI